MSRFDDYDEFDEYTGDVEYTVGANYKGGSAGSGGGNFTPDGYRPELDSAFIQNPLENSRRVVDDYPDQYNGQYDNQYNDQYDNQYNDQYGNQYNNQYSDSQFSNMNQMDGQPYQGQYAGQQDQQQIQVPQFNRKQGDSQYQDRMDTSQYQNQMDALQYQGNQGSDIQSSGNQNMKNQRTDNQKSSRKKAQPQVFVPKTRVYDPDQLISDDVFENTYEEDYYDSDYDDGSDSSYSNYDNGEDYSEYDEDYASADAREIRQEKRQRSREKEQARKEKQNKKIRASEEEAIRAEVRNDLEKQEKIKKSEEKKLKKKKNPVKKFFFRLLIFILILIMAFGAAVINITRRFTHIDSAVSQRADSMKHGVVNILLIGQDAREGQSGQRSDSMILLSVNQKKNHVCMTSIMRDTYVNIPGYGNNKLNAAYAFGGIDLLDQTIEENFGIRIDGNAMVDLGGFLDAMTALGELDIELSAEEAQYMNENPGLGSDTDHLDEEWNLTEGVNKLTPNQILCYSRMRYVGNSDWDRTARQRNVISAALSHIKHGHLVGGYKMATKAAPSISTDMNNFGMMRMGAGIVLGGEMESHIIPVEGTYYPDTIDGMAVLVPDIEANKTYLQQYINGETEE